MNTIKGGLSTAVAALVLGVVLLLALAGCAYDQQEFDARALRPEHEAAFQQAAFDLNAERGSRFWFSDNATSHAFYGQPPSGHVASSSHSLLEPWNGWIITFLAGDPKIADPTSFYYVARHELCHVVGIGHGQAC